MASIRERFRNAWNVFRNNRDPTFEVRPTYVGMGNSYRPDRPRLTRGAERTIINSIINRISIDCASVQIQHVYTDQNGRYLSKCKSTLNDCLSVEANIDQTGRELIQDLVFSMCDEGAVALVPTDTDTDLWNTESYEILELRVAKIVEWFPEYIRVECYNELTGRREETILPKSECCIVTNPLYSVMNEPNSTLKRLVHKLNLLDFIDEQSSSGKLNLIIQLPYVIKTEARRKEAEKRRLDIQEQLEESKYGIAYTDGTEKIQQLNRPIENNMLETIEYLTDMLYGQLGITKEVIDGTADEQTMLNYNNRTIEPILSTICDEMKRKFLTKTARTQGQSIMFFRDPFKLVPIASIADIAMKFTTNEILSSNEVRSLIGFKPIDDTRADELRNKNLYNTDLDVAPVNTENTVDNELPPGEEQYLESPELYQLPPGYVNQNDMYLEDQYQ